ncbi:acyltransferase-domain-containing protein [Mycotypha africana]|uniref:acyltransferase-domain-containing protein n=1 Tax=Mycotypha africana TaxID=64632 RepID=UPI002300344E|nr:acyltransferase-domain-containing protein [Mycotypha africana]KAI8990917.1 acyltransferase-domain-containing protein [Mycotypha africana]
MWRFMTATVIGSIGTLSKLFLGYFNDTKVHGLEQFLRILQDPQRKKGILTVSNHESVLDDPVLWGVLPLSVLFSPERMRWVLGAADICYTSVFRSYFFVFGQTIPTIRGAGIYQPALDFSIHHLQKKGWVHIYPEAKVSQDNNGKMIRFKWGIGRILMDSSNAVSADTMSNSKEIDGDNREPVIVIPIWHKGMHLVKPLYGTKLAHVGKPITIVYGDPVSYGDILDSWKLGKLTREEARIELTQRVYDAIEKLQKEYDNNTANSL